MNNENLYTDSVPIENVCGENEGTAYFEYLNFREADLFTVICLPEKDGKYPTVIFRSPYVDADQDRLEEGDYGIRDDINQISHFSSPEENRRFKAAHGALQSQCSAFLHNFSLHLSFFLTYSQK